MNDPVHSPEALPDNDPGAEHVDEPWRDRNLWLRFLLMLLFGAVYWIAQFAVGLTALIQFGFSALAGERSAPLHRFAAGLSGYVTEIIDFLMFQSEHRPFPFNEFPEKPPAGAGADAGAAAPRSAPRKKTAKK